MYFKMNKNIKNGKKFIPAMIYKKNGKLRLKIFKHNVYIRGNHMNDDKQHSMDDNNNSFLQKASYVVSYESAVEIQIGTNNLVYTSGLQINIKKPEFTYTFHS